MASEPRWVECAACARYVVGYVPRGGDGTGLRPRRHKDPGGHDCDGRLDIGREVTPGNTGDSR